MWVGEMNQLFHANKRLCKFRPLKIGFQPCFLQILKDFGLLYKIHIIVMFVSCVRMTQFVREHDRAKNVAWMLLWCSLDADCVFFHTVFQRSNGLITAHTHIQTRYRHIHNSTHTISKFWCVWGSSLNVIVYFKSHSHLLTKLMTYNVIYWCNH